MDSTKAITETNDLIREASNGFVNSADFVSGAYWCLKMVAAGKIKVRIEEDEREAETGDVG